MSISIWFATCKKELKNIFSFFFQKLITISLLKWEKTVKFIKKIRQKLQKWFLIFFMTIWEVLGLVELRRQEISKVDNCKARAKLNYKWIHSKKSLEVCILACYLQISCTQMLEDVWRFLQIAWRFSPFQLRVKFCFIFFLLCGFFFIIKVQFESVSFRELVICYI